MVDGPRNQAEGPEYEHKGFYDDEHSERILREKRALFEREKLRMLRESQIDHQRSRKDS